MQSTLYKTKFRAMDRKYNKDLLPFSKELRRNMTAEERHLWFDFLRTYPVKFTRQKILGRYIADFYCPQAKLVIELDGSQHYEDNEIEKDSERTKYLEQYGLKVIRIPNNEVKQNFQSVCEYIDIVVKKRIEKINDSGQ